MWDGQKWQSFVLEDEWPAGNVFDLVQDDSGAIWVLDGTGVYRTTVEASTWERVPDLVGDRMLLVDEGMWVAGDYAFFFHDGESPTRYQRQEIEGFHDGNINAIALDSQGRLYFGQDRGFTIKDGDTYIAVGEAEGWNMGNIRTLLALEDGIYAGTTQGLVRLNDSQWETLMEGANIASIVQWTDGTLLLGTTSGLIYFKDGESRAEEMVGASVNDIQVLEDGQIWLTAYSSGGGLLGIGEMDTGDGGLYHYDGSTWEQFGTADGLFRYSPVAVLVDSARTVWAGGFGGIVQLVR